MIQALLFDMDGLMFNTERIAEEGWRQVAAREGFLLDPDRMEAIRGTNELRCRQLFSQWYGETVDFSHALDQCHRYIASQLEENGVPLKKGLPELLEYAKKNNIPAAVATSTPRRIASRYWDLAGVTSYFSASVCGDEVTLGKPNPQIFLMAAERLGVAPENCLVLEDSPNGLRAGHAGNMYVGMVPDIAPATEELRRLCSFVFEDLSQVIPVLEKQREQRR